VCVCAYVYFFVRVHRREERERESEREREGTYPGAHHRRYRQQRPEPFSARGTKITRGDKVEAVRRPKK